MTTLKIIADQDKCCGSGQCVLLAPEVFDQREEDGIVTLLTETAGPGQEASVREAAAVCPAAAIDVQEI